MRLPNVHFSGALRWLQDLLGVTNYFSRMLILVPWQIGKRDPLNTWPYRIPSANRDYRRQKAIQMRQSGSGLMTRKMLQNLDRQFVN